MPDDAPSPAEDVLDQLSGEHIDVHSLALVVHPLLPRRVLDAVVVRRLGQVHGTTGLTEHGRVDGPAYGRHDAHAQRLELDPQGFRHTRHGGLGTSENAWSRARARVARLA